MGAARIICPTCGRTLGDTDKSIDATLNCPGCRMRVHVQMAVVSFKDYFNKATKQEQKTNDKSK